MLIRVGGLLGSAAAVVTLSGALAGCAAFSDGATPVGGPRGTISVAAAFYPLQFVSERVGGDRVTVDDLTRPGQEPHDLELTPKEVGQVALADVVVYSRGLQASVDAAVRHAGGTVVDAAAIAGLEPLSHGGHDDVSHHQGETVDEEARADGDLDPHFWQDPLRMAAVARAVADAFVSVDPGHAATYRANAAGLDADLRTLDHDYATGLASCARDTIVVSHDAFGYLGRYGLHLEPIAGLSPDAEPTPADLGRLQKLITSEGITTVFGERLVPAELSATLARDMGVATEVLDPIEGLTDQTSSEDYLSLMRSNLAALRKANGCQ